MVFQRLPVSASIVEQAGQPVYTYRLTHSAPDDAGVSEFFVDVSIRNVRAVVPGAKGDLTFQSIERALRKKGIRVIAVELSRAGESEDIPYSRDGEASWGPSAFDVPMGTLTIDNLKMRVLDGKSLPGIRNVRVSPSVHSNNYAFTCLLPSIEDEDSVIAQKRASIRALDWKSKSIGPVLTDINAFSHCNRLRAEVAKAIALGWIADSSFATNVTDQPASARQSFDARDYATTTQRLQTLLAATAARQDFRRCDRRCRRGHG
jgi:hypothetical protein